MSCGIYRIVNNVNGKIYIGQSVNIEQRWKGHKLDSREKSSRKKYPIHYAIHKYGIQNFEFEVLVECPKEQLDSRQEWWIGYYRKNNPAGVYNIQDGGTNPPHTLKPVYCVELDKYYDSIKQAADDLGLDACTIGAICNKKSYRHSCGGYHFTFADQTENVSYGKFTTYAKKVICKQTEQIYNSCKQTAEKLGTAGNVISSICTHVNSTWNGYHFAYYDEWLEKGDSVFTNGSRSKKHVYCEQTGDMYTSIHEAARQNNISVMSISNCCNGKNKSCKGMHFRFM